MLKINLEDTNYRAKIVKLEGLRKHSNADKLQVATIDFNNVITGLEAKDGDIYVYFPLECAMDVGIDTNNLYPYHIDEILERMKTREVLLNVDHHSKETN